MLALTLQQLGDPAGLRRKQSRELIEKKFRTGLDLGGGAHGFWFDWIFARTLLREAERLNQSQAQAAR